MIYRYHTADVFTDRIFGGNPLAVFPDARGLATERMQSIARELNLSETVFVLPPESPEHTRRLHIFTPGVELPFAGHPTVGSAYVLAALGDITLDGDDTPIVFEEGVGPVPVSIHVVDGRPVSATLSAAQMPEIGPEPPSVVKLAALLSLSPDDFTEGELTPQAVSCGVPFLFVSLRNRDALARASLETSLWKEVLANYWAPHLFLLTRDPERAGSDLRACMFAPAMGIAEDPATGAAATALGGYLAARDAKSTGTLRFIVEQGFEMGRPSILEVEADKREGEIVAIRVGGSSGLVGRCEIKIPE